MTDGFLSQEEIDALLRGDTNTSPELPSLSDIELDALGEIGNISMGSAATTLSILLNRRVSITTPRVEVTNLNMIKSKYPLPYLVIEVGYTHGLIGTNILAIKQQDALIIADLMMGGDGSAPPQEMNDLYMSAVSEAMNQMMGSNATSMSTIFKKRIDIAPPAVSLSDFSSDTQVTSIVKLEDPIVRVAFHMEVEGLIDTEIMQIMSIDVAQELVSSLMEVMNQKSQQQVTNNSKTLTNLTNETAKPAHVNPGKPVKQEITSTSAGNYEKPVTNVAVQPVQFAPLQVMNTDTSENNIGLIMDVPLQVTVELGRTRKMIKDILELGPGSVIELDKLAGEPVDILINGKLIAKGEVVVIDENFGVRITQIISQMERLNNLQ